MQLFKRFQPVFVFYALGLIISFCTRLILFIIAFHNLDLSITNLLGIFFIGVFYDICFLSFAVIPIVLLCWLNNDGMYKKPWVYILLGIMVILVIGSFINNPIPKEYDKKLPVVLSALLILLTGMYVLLYKKTVDFRNRWRTAFFYVLFFIITFLLVFNIISEIAFWQEFGVRYNFIAVDYLIYTNEVIGNIKESYPIGWIIFGVVVISILIFWSIKKFLKSSSSIKVSFTGRTVFALILLAIPVLVYTLVNNSIKQFSNNDYVNELAGNGVYEFATAFFSNDLDYYKFYNTIPDEEAIGILRKQILERSPTDSFINTNGYSIERIVRYPEPEKKLNIVLISIESISAKFLNSFGNTQNITPFLDSLAQHSLFFTNCYATGTRTVRGLEVLSLSIPPIPGQSIVRRANNDSLFSIGSVLRSKGYTTQFLYGGYSSFDNMGPYFSANGYEVIDRSALKPKEIHYANIWGVADEDMFTLALKKFDEDYQTGKPFFGHIMTVSNHRPYTYPEGRIDISPKEQKREGAVKYTDFCINQFLKQAAQKPWFANTVFVIVADHCASAAGKQALPVTGYHIPLFIYSPAHITPQKVSQMVSQMDVVPTVLGLLNMSYRSKFFGQDIFRIPTGKERVLISTFNALGFLKDSNLVVLTPPQKSEQQQPDFETGEATPTPTEDSLFKQGVSYYQMAEKIFKSGGYKQ
ncbi:MAG: LTA synthase family protein [Niabella sp.]